MPCNWRWTASSLLQAWTPSFKLTRHFDGKPFGQRAESVCSCPVEPVMLCCFRQAASESCWRHSLLVCTRKVPESRCQEGLVHVLNFAAWLGVNKPRMLGMMIQACRCSPCCAGRVSIVGVIGAGSHALCLADPAGAGELSAWHSSM